MSIDSYILANRARAEAAAQVAEQAKNDTENRINVVKN